MTKQEHWKDEVEFHDFDAAEEYLRLLATPAIAKSVADELRNSNAPLEWYKAKDLLRASRLPLLLGSNVHVAKDLRKIKDGEKLSPILVLRGDWERDSALGVADGYHRICASYFLDENAEIPCRIV